LFQGPGSSSVDVSWYYVDPDQQIQVRGSLKLLLLLNCQGTIL
jgi:hypothetical protein